MTVHLVPRQGCIIVGQNAVGPASATSRHTAACIRGEGGQELPIITGFLRYNPLIPVGATWNPRG